MNVWLYHINPKSPQNWEYGWDLARPETLLASRDKVWPAGNFFRMIKPGDRIAILMKNTGSELGDGVYIVGEVTDVHEERRELVWRPDIARSAPLLDSPIPVPIVREHFGRGYGSALQRLPDDRQREWLRLIDDQAKPAAPRIRKTGRSRSGKGPQAANR